MSDNILDMLREKSEEGDLNSILKPYIGGYTKKSVQEYLAFVRKQQQSLKETYAAELQRLQDEKSGLQTRAASLKEQVLGMEAEYETKLEAQVAEQTAHWQAEVAALEKDMDEAVTRIKSDEEKIQRYEAELAAQKQKTEQVKQSVATCRVMLDTANGKISELTGQISAQAEEIARLQEVEQSLREALAEDKVSQLNAQVQELISDTEQLREEIAIRDRELENRARRLETLTRQEQNHHRDLEKLQSDLQAQREQNEWMDSENGELGRRLQAQMEQSIQTTRENSRLKTANAILQRKLDAAQLKWQLQDFSGADDR